MCASLMRVIWKLADGKVAQVRSTMGEIGYVESGAATYGPRELWEPDVCGPLWVATLVIGFNMNVGQHVRLESIA